MRIEYSSNNSGGGWWLSDKDWKNLEKAGWHVVWGGTYFCHSNWNPAPDGKPEPCAIKDVCPGHRRFESAKETKAANGEWLGALAREASKEFPRLEDAVDEWERITGQNAEDEGCSCCGRPHYFSEAT